MGSEGIKRRNVIWRILELGIEFLNLYVDDVREVKGIEKV